MPTNRVVSPSDEPVEFRPLPGQEADWAGADYVPGSPLWLWIGAYPVGAYLIYLLVLLGMVAL